MPAVPHRSSSCGDSVHDLSKVAETCSGLLALDDPLAAVRAAGDLPRIGGVADLLENSAHDRRDRRSPWLIAPCDLQAVKASGVTFVASLLERVIEEQARGDAARAEGLRRSILSVIGNSLHDVRPGSPEAMQLKDVLIGQGSGRSTSRSASAPTPRSSRSARRSPRSAPAPTSASTRNRNGTTRSPKSCSPSRRPGRVAGASLGNDVNLRDFEGRSALLLGKAKDNNASCAIGPFIRLFDETFSLDDVRQCDLALNIRGSDGFAFTGRSSMAEISRDPLEIVGHTIGPHHQYPDGVMLFLGTMFAPTVDRFAPGKGFTHLVGDIVSVSTPTLGTLVNRVNHTDKIAPWTFGSAR